MGLSFRRLPLEYTPRQQAAVFSGDRVSGRLKLLNKSAASAVRPLLKGTSGQPCWGGLGTVIGGRGLAASDGSEWRTRT